MSLFAWAAAAYVAVGAILAAFLAFAAWSQGDPIGWGRALRYALGWPAFLWAMAR